MIWALVCAGACAVLVVAEHRGLRRLRAASKTIASLAFVALGVRAAGGGAFAQWVLAGLVLGAAGDVALLGAGKRAFAAGLALFLAGHVAYVVAVAHRLPPARWPGAAGLAALPPLAIGALALALLWPRLGALRAAVVAYVAVIVAMAVGAFAAARAGVVPPRFALGAGLFFASDLAVARDRFVARGFANRAWGLPAYYAGQLLIAWTATS